jgi:hypothetical protein
MLTKLKKRLAGMKLIAVPGGGPECPFQYLPAKDQ